MKHTGAFLALALALALADQLSKFWVFGVLPQGASVPWIPGVLACTPQLNPGVAFGLFGGHPWIVRAFTLVLAVVLWFWYRQAR
jgi:signal peptidase II